MLVFESSHIESKPLAYYWLLESQRNQCRMVCEFESSGITLIIAISEGGLIVTLGIW